MIATLALMLLLVPQEREPDIAGLEMLSGADKLPPIDDAAILAFVKKPFDPMSDPTKWPRTLGMHRGAPVVVSYTCSDVCPNYTKRIVRYNVYAGPACERMGGVSKDIVVPKGIGAGPRRYCIPAATDAWQE